MLLTPTANRNQGENLPSPLSKTSTRPKVRHTFLVGLVLLCLSALLLITGCEDRGTKPATGISCEDSVLEAVAAGRATVHRTDRLAGVGAPIEPIMAEFIEYENTLRDALANCKDSPKGTRLLLELLDHAVGMQLLLAGDYD